MTSLHRQVGILPLSQYDFFFYHIKSYASSIMNSTIWHTATSLFPRQTVTTSLCTHTVCHMSFGPLLSVTHTGLQCPVAVSWVSSTGSRLFPHRCCGLETPWWSDMPQQQELTPWSPEVLKDVSFSRVVFHMQPTLWLAGIVGIHWPEVRNDHIQVQRLVVSTAL